MLALWLGLACHIANASLALSTPAAMFSP